MRDSANIAFSVFSLTLEGYVPWMYSDVKGLITTGVGNLIDTSAVDPATNYSKAGGTMPADAIALPWLLPDGNTMAGKDYVMSTWQVAKNHTRTPGRPGPDMSQMGGGNWKTLMSNTVHLDAIGIKQLMAKKVASNEAVLRSRIPAFDSFPADAQLALHSWSWAGGPGGRYPKMLAALNAIKPDWATAAKEIFMPDKNNPGLVPRNKLNQRLMLNAGEVTSKNLDPNLLFLPMPLPGEGRDKWVARAVAAGTGLGGSTSTSTISTSTTTEAGPAMRQDQATVLPNDVTGQSPQQDVIEFPDTQDQFTKKNLNSFFSPPKIIGGVLFIGMITAILSRGKK